jgi:hypothetical protein
LTKLCNSLNGRYLEPFPNRIYLLICHSYLLLPTRLRSNVHILLEERNSMESSPVHKVFEVEPSVGKLVVKDRTETEIRKGGFLDLPGGEGLTYMLVALIMTNDVAFRTLE